MKPALVPSANRIDIKKIQMSLEFNQGQTLCDFLSEKVSLLDAELKELNSVIALDENNLKVLLIFHYIIYFYKIHKL